MRHYRVVHDPAAGSRPWIVQGDCNHLGGLIWADVTHCTSREDAHAYIARVQHLQRQQLGLDPTESSQRPLEGR